MRQTLFYIPKEIFGFPVFGFGLAFLLLVVGIVIAAAWRYAKTKRFDEDIVSYLGLLAVGSGILVFVAPNVMEPEGFPIRGYGVCLLVAILSSLALVLHLSKRKNVPSELIFSLCLWSVITGILGARIFYVTEYWPTMVAHDELGNMILGQTLFNIVNIAKGGLVVYGSIFGGMIGAIGFMRYAKMPVFQTLDMMAPAMMLGIAIGRIGCFLNGCCFGGVCDLPWAVVFPEGSPPHIYQIEHGETFYYGLKFEEKELAGSNRLEIREVQSDSEAQRAGLLHGMVLKGIGGMVHGKPKVWEVRSAFDAFELIHQLHHLDPAGTVRLDVYTDATCTATKPYFVGGTPSRVLPVHPTQLYSSFGSALVCLILLGLGRLSFFRNRDGMILVAFLFLYSILRFLLEMIRTDEGSFLGTGLTVSQNVCIAVFAAAILLSFWVLSRKTGSVKMKE